MGFLPDPNGDVDAPLVEYLGSQPGRDAEDRIVAVLTFRFFPSISFVSGNVALTHAQAVRLRDDLDSLLTTPGSWLHLGQE